MLTERYSLVHQALIDVARRHRLVPFDVRVLVAVLDAGGEVGSADLEAALICDGSATRRSLVNLYERRLAVGIAADGGRRRPGKRSWITLTASGRAVADELVEATR